MTVCFTCYSLSLQNLMVRIEGNNLGTDGTRAFTIFLNEGDNHLISGVIDGTDYFKSIDVTIEEDDGTSNVHIRCCTFGIIKSVHTNALSFRTTTGSGNERPSDNIAGPNS